MGSGEYSITEGRVADLAVTVNGDEKRTIGNLFERGLVLYDGLINYDAGEHFAFKRLSSPDIAKVCDRLVKGSHEIKKIELEDAR